MTRRRLEVGKSIHEVAREAHMGYARTWAIENGLRSRRAERMKLAAVLGCEPDDLLSSIERGDSARVAEVLSAPDAPMCFTEPRRPEVDGDAQ